MVIEDAQLLKKRKLPPWLTDLLGDILFDYEQWSYNHSKILLISMTIVSSFTIFTLSWSFQLKKWVWTHSSVSLCPVIHVININLLPLLYFLRFTLAPTDIIERTMSILSNRILFYKVHSSLHYCGFFLINLMTMILHSVDNIWRKSTSGK